MNKITHSQNIIPLLHAANASPCRGDIIDNKLRLEQRIDNGGQGDVFEATHTSLLIPVAIKILKRSLSTDIDIKRFEKEAQTLAELNHPNIVKIFDAGEFTDKFNYLVTELLRGESFNDWIQSSNPNDVTYLSTIIKHLSHICGGIKCAHQRNIIHRDINPGNLFLHEEFDGSITPKILDFGIAKDLKADTNLTQTGFIPGTTEYIAPELLRGAAPSPQSDIYSIGVVLYQAICGRNLYDTDNNEAILSLALDNSYCPPPPIDVNPLIPKELNAVCLKALERNIQKRYQTVEQLKQDLESIQILHTDCRIPRPKPQSTKRVHWVYLSIIVLLLAGFIWNPTWLQLEKEAETDTTQPERNVASKSSASEESNIKSVQESIQVSNSSPLRSSFSVPSNQNSPQIIAPITPNSSAPPQTEGLTSNVSIENNDIVAPPAPQNTSEKPAKEYPPEVSFSADERAAQAWDAFQQDNYKKSIRLYKRALRKKNLPQWRLQLGQAFLAANNKTMAIAQWHQVLNEVPQGEQFHRIAKELLANTGVDIE